MVCWTALPIAPRMWVKNSGELMLACELAQVLIVPRRFDAVVDAGRVRGAVPADAEPIAVRGLGAEPRVQALVH